MDNARKLIEELWTWLERLAAKRAAGGSRVQPEYIESRRREVMRRAAGQSGTY